jgi:putative ABC transport system substrate-binding protein
MMDRRKRSLIVAGMAFLAAGDLRAAAPAGKAFAIGVLYPDSPESAATVDAALRKFLQALGYVEGRNVTIERRFARDRYSQIHSLAAELAVRKPTLLLTYGVETTVAARMAAPEVPIVGWSIFDPVGAGLTSSLARPDRNVTGIASMGDEIALKRMEVLLALAPRARRVGILFNPDTAGNRTQVEILQRPATSLGVELALLPIRNSNDLSRELATYSKQRYDALYQCQDTVLKFAAITRFALEHRIPNVGPHTRYVAEGGLAGFGVDREEQLKQAVDQVDRILNGARPADLPFLRPTHFELALNLKTARAIGVEVPQHLLVSAKAVIE